MSQTVRWEIESGVARVTLARPETGNVLNPALIQPLSQALQAAVSEPTCRAIVLGAEGEDFCKGMDLDWALTQPGSSEPDPLAAFQACLAQIRQVPLPVIACVEGNVTGGGLGLVAVCDIVLAQNTVTFMLPEVILGLIPALIAPFLLRRMSVAHLQSLTLSSRSITAHEAQALGLVDEVTLEGMGATLNRQLQRLFRSSPAAIAQSKQYFAQLEADTLQRQLALAHHQLAAWLARPDGLDGVRAFTRGFSPPWFAKYRD